MSLSTSCSEKYHQESNSKIMNIIYPFPVLHPESLDYDCPEEIFSVEFSKSDKGTVTIEYKLKQESLVGSLVKNGTAVFFGTVCARGTIFRATRSIDAQAVNLADELLLAKQVISLPNFSWKPRVIACGGVSLTTEKSVNLNDFSEVSSFITDIRKEYDFKRNSMIAFSGWMELFSLLSLFRIHSKKEINPGEFLVSTSSANQLQINISMHPKLFEEVDNYKHGSARAHVLCTALTSTLKEIHAAYIKPTGEAEQGDEQLIEEAEILQEFLIRNNIPTWEDNEFNAASTASKCYKVFLEIERRQ